MSDNVISFSASAGVPAKQQQVGHALLHEPLRRLAPASRAIAKCKRDLEPVDDAIKPLTPKQKHELMLPRIAEVLPAAQLFDAIVNSDAAVAPELIFDYLKILQTTISTQRKSEDETTSTMLSGMALFDFDVDSAGARLAMWKEIPRHPMVVALATHALITKATFSPSLAELAWTCRTVRDRLENGFKVALEWLNRFNQLDVDLAMRTRASHDEWARYLTLDKIANIEAITELLRYFKRDYRGFDTTRLQDASRRSSRGSISSGNSFLLQSRTSSKRASRRLYRTRKLAASRQQLVGNRGTSGKAASASNQSVIIRNSSAGKNESARSSSVRKSKRAFGTSGGSSVHSA
jgi:hypothetical protein